MAFDAHKNLAISAVATIPSPATSGLTLHCTAGHGTRFPTPPFNATVAPANTTPDPSNSEIIRVTAISTDTFTIVRAQEGTSARSIAAGDQIFAGETAKTLTDIEAAIPTAFYSHIFGDGSDGNCTLDGTNTFAGWATKASAVYTMTADSNCLNISLTTSAVLIPNGFRIKLQGNLTIGSGCVIGNATPNAGATGSAGTAGASGGSGTIAGGQAGGAGVATGTGSAGSKGMVGAGGAGGAGTTGSAGASVPAVLTTAGAVKAALSAPQPVLANVCNYGGITTRPIMGGTGGSGGAGDSTNKGGGGGAGGDPVCILCLGNVINNGTITAVGAAGGVPTLGNCGGGGGGAGGFIGIWLRGAYSGSGTTVVTGGAAGAGVGTGATASAGGVGQVLTTVLE